MLKRWPLAVLVGGLGIGALLPGMPAGEVLSRARVAALVPALLVLAVALGVGVVAGRRALVAGAAAYSVGVTLWLWLYLKPSPPWSPSDVWFLGTWIEFAFTNVLAGAVVCAVGAAIGAWLERAVVARLARAQPEREP
jgi:hypothetical protein